MAASTICDIAGLPTSARADQCGFGAGRVPVGMRKSLSDPQKVAVRALPRALPCHRIDSPCGDALERARLAGSLPVTTIISCSDPLREDCASRIWCVISLRLRPITATARTLSRPGVSPAGWHRSALPQPRRVPQWARAGGAVQTQRIELCVSAAFDDNDTEFQQCVQAGADPVLGERRARYERRAESWPPCNDSSRRRRTLPSVPNT
jgi:hypothetical protein